VGAGVGVAPAEDRGAVPLGLGCAELGVGVSTADSVGVAPTIVSEADTDGFGPSDELVDMPGVPTAPWTAPVG
jgi:hypothetical protein